jgi:hypothetical protein
MGFLKPPDRTGFKSPYLPNRRFFLFSFPNRGLGTQAGEARLSRDGRRPEAGAWERGKGRYWTERIFCPEDCQIFFEVRMESATFFLTLILKYFKAEYIQSLESDQVFFYFYADRQQL